MGTGNISFGEPLTLTVDGIPLQACRGQTIAAALYASGRRTLRTTRVNGKPRGLYCAMGVCYDCLAEIDGIPNRQSCLVEVRAGMHIRRQIGVRRIDPAI